MAESSDWAGDGCFLTFETPSAAVSFALRLQEAHRDEPDLPGELLSVHPRFTLQTSVRELRKWSFPDEVTRRYLDGLREAGVPAEPRD